MNWNPKFALCLMFVSAVFVSCGLGDDLTDCVSTEKPVDPPVEPEIRTLKAVFVHEASDIDLGGERFDCASLYVFDPAGALVSVRELDYPIFNEVFDTGWTLDAGDYEFVVWVNCVDPYSLTACDNRADGRMVIEVPADGYASADLPWLLYGEKDYSVVDAGDEQVVVIPIVLNNYIVNLEVSGITPNDDEYEFEVSGGNNTFDFDNEPDGTGFSYRVPAKFVNGVLTGELSTVGFGKTGAAYLKIIDKTTGKVIWPTDPEDESDLVTIVDGIDQGGNDTTHDIDIELGLEQTTPTDPGDPTELRLAKVVVNGWEAQDDDYAVGPQR